MTPRMHSRSFSHKASHANPAKVLKIRVGGHLIALKPSELSWSYELAELDRVTN